MLDKNMRTSPGLLVVGSILFRVSSAVVLIAGLVGLCVTKTVLGYFGLVSLGGAILFGGSYTVTRYAKNRLKIELDEETGSRSLITKATDV